MMKLLLTLGFALLVAGSAFAGNAGGDMEQQQQQMSGKIVVNVPPAPPDHTAAYIAAGATVLTAGLGYLGVRANRKR